MRILCIGLLLLLLCGACGKDYDHKGRTPIVELNGKFLYVEDVLAVLPTGLSDQDSVAFAERYLQNWMKDVLLYEKAGNNIPDDAEIERLVENYRKALIVHSYQQALIHQQLSEEISEQELMDYYEKHQELFCVERPLLKGLFIKVPLGAAGVNNVRRWYKSDAQEAVEHLEKYSLQHAVKYEYFRDKWVPMAEILDLLPLDADDLDSRLNKSQQVELKDTAFYYFLNVSERLQVGEQTPFEFARSQVKDILLNMKQVEFMERVKQDMLDQAIEKGKIKYYIEH